jgi:hypothetical protein
MFRRFGARIRTVRLAGWKPKALPRVLFGRETRVECVMKDELMTILEAMRAAQAELAAYLTSATPN